MKITYDKKIDAMYISFFSGKKRAARTFRVKDYLFVDIGEKGKLHGIEILDASSHVPLEALPKKQKVTKK